MTKQQLNSIEAQVLERCLQEIGLQKPISLDQIQLSILCKERRFSAKGFFTELKRNIALKVKSNCSLAPWGNIGARINDTLEVGFVVFVEDEYIDTLEGFTFGEPWPSSIESIEFYHLNFDK